MNNARGGDIIVATGNATDYVVNNFDTGEWMKFTINVARHRSGKVCEGERWQPDQRLVT